MRFTILAHGSRGDIQPYIALGIGLQRAGHAVRLAAPGLYQRFIESYSLEFAPLAGDPTRLMRSAVEKAGRWPAPMRTARVVLQFAAPIAAELYADALSACRDADAIIHSLLLTSTGHQIANDLGCPDFSALVFAFFAPTAAFPNPLFPAFPFGSRYNLESHIQFNRVFWRGNRLAFNWIRRTHPAVPELVDWPFENGLRRPTPLLYGFSPNVIPVPEEWGQDVHVTGYWFLDAPPGWQPEPGLVEFLEAGPPPVYIGFGSVISREMGQLTWVALDALDRSGQRGVLSTGWGGLQASDLPAHVYPIESAPFDWLFPRMAATVHHGGMGTTAASLRAGVPPVIVPFMADQPFWGRQIQRLNAGPAPIPHKLLTPRRLAQAITTALEDETMRSRTAELGALIRAEDGVGKAVAVIEGYLERWSIRSRTIPH
jgi:sterol 3beta-glucosyltransferase